MNDPVNEVSHVIHLLTQTAPSLQEATIEKYFTPNAQFTHPFCRTFSFANSRYLVARTYRWYKIMSPKISMKIQSISFDRSNSVLYVGLTQVFSIWAIPTHRSEVSLVTVLHLQKAEDGKYYISSQNDLYQTDQFIRFVLPWIAWLVPLWQFIATLVCVVCSYVFGPVTWWEENRQTHFQRIEKPPKWNDAI